MSTQAQGKSAVLFKKALNKQRGGDMAAAETLYIRITRSDPHHLDAHYLLGTLYAERGDLQRGLKYLLRAAEIAPRSHLVHNNLGNLYHLLGDLDQAIVHLQRALDLRPNMPEAHHNLAGILKKQDRFDEAISHYQKAVLLKPDFSEAHRILGTLYRKAGKNESAIRHLQRYLAINPADEGIVRLELASLQSGPTPERYPIESMRETYEQKAATWDSDIERPQMEFLGPQLVEAALKKHIKTRKKLDILDIGCGTGICGKFLRPRAKRLDGVDLSQHMLAEAEKKQCYDMLACEDIIDFMRAHPASYDLIIGSGVLILLGDLKAVLQAAASAMRPGASFVFTLYRSEDAAIQVRNNLHFAHSREHLLERSAEAGLSLLSLEAVIHEYNDGVAEPGWVVVLRVAESLQ